MTDLIWIHDECLRADHPVFTEGKGEAVFIWDKDYMNSMSMGFKQKVFIYEALTDLPVTIYQGSTPALLLELAQGGGITTAASPNPYLRDIMTALRARLELTTVEDEVFAHLSGTPDLRRFFRYWNKAKSSAMQPHGGTPDLFGDSFGRSS
ncbi:MAG: hypothetical protein J4F41_02140 [Alphaproteobacteria bacterium]|nr:hypothetical protein [Alphaproteobacteria bacterium]